jgi:hypothetical protein
MAAKPKYTREDVAKFAQQQAMGFAVAWLMAEHFKRSTNPAAEADYFLRVVESLGDRMTYPELGPEWSDVAAQELRDSLSRIGHRARALSTGEAFDPDRFRGRWPESDG